MGDRIKINPLVSIIVPAYNSSRYLSQCMNSLLTQTYSNIEIILVDDGSTDSTGCICDKYAEEFERVKVIHQTNQGQASARNNGFRISKGHWICYVDSDDVVHPQLVETLLTMAREHNVRISLCGYKETEEIPDHFEILQEPRYRCVEINEKSIFREIFDTWCIWAKLIDKEIIEKFGFEEGRIYEDNAVILEWLSEAGKIAFTREAYYYYRINPEGTTKKPFNVKKLDLLWALEQRLLFCIKNNYRRLLGRSLIFYIHNTMYMCCEVKKLGEKAVAKSVKYGTLRFVLRSIRYSSNKPGVLLRAMKLWILY